MPSIIVSDENYRKLQKLARAFEDSPDDVIGRLADSKLTGPPANGDRSTVDHRSAAPASALVSRGGRIPDGAILKATYKGQEYEAQVKGGRVWWNGRRYSTVSAAAVAVIRSTGSSRPTENGWRFWRVFPPDPQSQE